MAAGLAALDRTGDLDRAGEQQQLFRQRRLTGVRVGNDGKGAAAAGFGGVGHRMASEDWLFSTRRHPEWTIVGETANYLRLAACCILADVHSRASCSR